ncbi:MAG: Bax inhibitor-1/YccA family protein [Alphaproteobacteria bacterium]|nr:Bax inhibitor-1/YccA family protein [Alphaproteobacteria bacterium]
MAVETGKRYYTRVGTTADQAVVDAGLRSYMLRVYNYMASGVALTGIVAYLVAATPALSAAIFGTPLKWVVILAPIVFVFFFSSKLEKMKASTAHTMFWVFAALMGLSLASAFIVFTGQSIARVFFITAGTFAAMSLYGYTTKRDLSKWGSFLIMGLIGVILASLVNIFVGSSALQFAISVIGVLVFVGLTAYDTQDIKNMYSEHYDSETMSKLSISGALRLYLDFINLFMLLLQFLGIRREE